MEVYMMRYLANLRLGTPTHIYLHIPRDAIAVTIFEISRHENVGYKN
jgi:hypothetical protein